VSAIRGVIDQVEAIDMVETTALDGRFSAAPTGIRVHVLNRGGSAWIEWPAALGNPVIGQQVSIEVSA
jgi:hypothetical protein